MNIRNALHYIGVCLIFAGLAIHTGITLHRASNPELAPPVEVVEERPEMCYYLYNVGRHKEWCECMGVAYVE